jgi:hypothetical protein
MARRPSLTPAEPLCAAILQEDSDPPGVICLVQGSMFNVSERLSKGFAFFFILNLQL